MAQRATPSLAYLRVQCDWEKESQAPEQLDASIFDDLPPLHSDLELAQQAAERAAAAASSGDASSAGKAVDSGSTGASGAASSLRSFWLSAHRPGQRDVYATCAGVPRASESSTVSADVVGETLPVEMDDEALQARALDVRVLAVQRKSEDKAASGSSASAGGVGGLMPAALHVVDSVSGVNSRVLAPSGEYAQLHGLGPGTTRPVYALDVSSEKVPGQATHLAVSGSAEGMLRAWHAETGMLCRDMKGHVGDVDAARFFPSGQLVLSGGADRTVRIWALDLREHSGAKAYLADGVAVFSGHSRGVTALEIVGRGQQVVSSGRDGQVNLWDCSAGAAAATFRADAAVNDVALLGADPVVVAAACEDGNVHAFDSRVRATPAYSVDLGAPVNCCMLANTAQPLVIAGTKSGKLSITDARQPSTPLQVLQSSDVLGNPIPAVQAVDASILALTHDLTASNTFWFSTSQGDAVQCSLDTLWAGTSEALTSCLDCVLTGSDCDPIAALALCPGKDVPADASQPKPPYAPSSILAGCHDGVVRKYSLKHASSS